MQNLRYAVIGATNVDIGGNVTESLTLHDSNIGRVKISSGGVGRNISENLARLGKTVNFFSAFSTDAFADFLQEELRKLEVTFSDSYISKKLASSTYLFINNSSGDMHVAINDMQLIESVPRSYFEKVLPIINKNDICVIDTNLSEENFSFLMENINIPIYVDPVSLTKAKKCIPYLSKIHTFKPNRLEAEYLTKEHNIEAAAKILLKSGVKRIFISLGNEGLYYADANNAGVVPSSIQNPVNTTGAGDTVTATLAATHGMPITQQAIAAVRASELCIMSPSTVAKKLNKKTLQNAMSTL